MKVYVVIDVHATYWGIVRCKVHGVYKTKEEAKKIEPSKYHDYTQIEEFELEDD